MISILTRLSTTCRRRFDQNTTKTTLPLRQIGKHWAEIIAFSFEEQTGDANIDSEAQTMMLKWPTILMHRSGRHVYFIDGASASGLCVQESGVCQHFTDPVTYKVTAETRLQRNGP